MKITVKNKDKEQTLNLKTPMFQHLLDLIGHIMKKPSVYMEITADGTYIYLFSGKSVWLRLGYHADDSLVESPQFFYSLESNFGDLSEEVAQALVEWGIVLILSLLPTLLGGVFLGDHRGIEKEGFSGSSVTVA